MTVLNVLDYGATGDGLVANEAPYIQSALDVAAGTGGTVYVPAGVYLLQAALEIGDDTLLCCDPGVVIRRNANSMNLLMNADRSVALYGGNHDIAVVGGLWDMNRAAYPTSGNGMIFGHCDRVTVEGATITGVHDDHHIEFNAVRCGRITGCVFTDFSRTRASEAVQLDLMKGVAQYPYGNAYDNTPCDDVLIEGCRFAGHLTRGIGTHSSTAGFYHTSIRIIGNHFEDLTGEPVLGLQWEHVVVMGNVAAVTGAAVYTNCVNVVAIGNVGIADTVGGPPPSIPNGTAAGDVLTWDAVSSAYVPRQPSAAPSGSVAFPVAGYTGAGASTEQMVSRKVYAKRITLASPALIASIGAYVQSDGVDHVGGLVAALYSDVAGAPGKILAASPMCSVDLLLQSAAGTQTPTPRWLDRAIGVTVPAGDYWIAVMDAGTSSQRTVIRKDSGGSDRTYTSGGNWAADWNRYTPTTTTDRYCIRASLAA